MSRRPGQAARDAEAARRGAHEPLEETVALRKIQDEPGFARREEELEIPVARRAVELEGQGGVAHRDVARFPRAHEDPWLTRPREEREADVHIGRWHGQPDTHVVWMHLDARPAAGAEAAAHFERERATPGERLLCATTGVGCDQEAIRRRRAVTFRRERPAGGAG